MSRRKEGEVTESIEQLRGLLKKSRGKLWAPRLKMLIRIVGHPDETLISIALRMGYSERHIRRWWKSYQDGGLERLLGIGVDEIVMGDVSRSASHQGEEDGRSVPRHIRDFLNGLPVVDDCLVWIKSMRDRLQRFLGDVDRVVISVNLACDLHDLDNNDVDIHLTQHIGGQASKRGTAVVTSNTHDTSKRRLLKELRKQGFPLREYQQPLYFEYHIERKAYVGTIILFRNKGAQPISPETIMAIEDLRPFLVFALSDCIARQRPNPLQPHAFSEIVAAIGQKENLTPRETQVLFHRLLGQDYEEIAAHLGVTPDTIHKHVGLIHRKAQASSATEIFARHMTPDRK